MLCCWILFFCNGVIEFPPENWRHLLLFSIKQNILQKTVKCLTNNNNSLHLLECFSECSKRFTLHITYIRQYVTVRDSKSGSFYGFKVFWVSHWRNPDHTSPLSHMSHQERRNPNSETGAHSLQLQINSNVRASEGGSPLFVYLSFWICHLRFAFHD